MPDLWQPTTTFARALVVVAHPDDAEFGAAGTVARWVEAGTDVRYVVVTDGASGSSDPEMTRERLADIRIQEQRAACAALGVGSVEFLGYPDGFLEPSIDARRAVAAAIRRHRPEVVLTLNPEVRWHEMGYINHPDHRAVGDLVLHSINPAASTRLWDTSLIDEGLEPWDVSELWLMGFREGSVRVDITQTFHTKVTALRCHASQLKEWDPEERLREWGERLGEEVGAPLAESFEVLRLRALDPDAPAESAPAAESEPV